MMGRAVVIAATFLFIRHSFELVAIAGVAASFLAWSPRGPLAGESAATQTVPRA